MPGPLHGVRVIEWGILHQGPQGAALLEAMGAEVIKVEETTGGDPFRSLPRLFGIPNQSPEGLSYLFETYNHGKKSIAVDLKKEEGRQILYRLVEKSDAFITNFRQEGAKRLGVDYETLKKYNPQLIYASSNSYGRRGPDANLGGTDFVAAHRVGLTTAMTWPDEPPRYVVGFVDETASILLAFAVLAGLHARHTQGVGQQVETSLQAAGMLIQSTMLGMAIMSGQMLEAWDRRRVNPLYNHYQAGDGKWFAIAAGANAPLANRYWPPFCKAIGRPDLLEDARFDTHELRIEFGEELIALLDEHFKTKSREEWLSALREGDVPVAPVQTHLELLNDPQVVANDYIQEYKHPAGATLRHLRFPIEFSATPAEVRKPAPKLGEHTDEILTKLLGYSPDEVARLYEQQVIAGPNHS